MFPVFVINLDRRPDRWRRISEHLEKLGIRATRVPAIDARVLATQDGESRKARVSGGSVCWRINLGAAAGMLSASKAMISLLGSTAPAGLILEDDAELAPDVPSLLESIDWWPVGARIVRLEESSQVSPYWYRSAPLGKPLGKTPSGRELRRLERWCGGSAAYLIDRRGAQVALSAFADPIHTVDHTLFNLRSSKVARRMRTVQVLPAMARQRDDDSSDQREWRKVAELHGWERRFCRLKRNIGAMPYSARVHVLRGVGLVKRVRVIYSVSPK